MKEQAFNCNLSKLAAKCVMLRLRPDVKDFKSLLVHFWFKRSQEAVKEPALMQVTQQAKAQCVLLPVILCLSLTSYLPIFLFFIIQMLG